MLPNFNVVFFLKNQLRNIVLTKHPVLMKLVICRIVVVPGLSTYLKPYYNKIPNIYNHNAYTSSLLTSFSSLHLFHVAWGPCLCDKECIWWVRRIYNC